MNTLEKIESLMKQRHWSIYRLANEAGLTQSTLFNVFKRKNEPSIKTLKAVCKGFGITLEEFFSEGDLDNPFHLTDEEKELIIAFRKMDFNQKENLQQLVDFAGDSDK